MQNGISSNLEIILAVFTNAGEIQNHRYPNNVNETQIYLK
jgi:hypothetical protein